MNENETERGEQQEGEHATHSASGTNRGRNRTADQARTNQNAGTNRSQGDIILQVHIANIFLTFCQRYARLCNRKIRRCLEFIVLLKGLGALAALIYAHIGYPLSGTCLDELKNKIPIESILRVEIGQRHSDQITPYLTEKYFDLAQQCPEDPGYWLPIHGSLLSESEKCNKSIANNKTDILDEQSQFIQDIEYPTQKRGQGAFDFSLFQIFNPLLDLHDNSWSPFYRFEFSHEFGYLRLSEVARKKRKVEVITVVLDPSKDKCFGSSLGKALLIEWFGYETVILDSIVSVSGNFGYVRNTITGEQFTVRHGYSKKKTIFIPVIACFAFTAAIAMLLRFAYKQVFMFVFRVLTSGLIDIWTLHNNFPYGAVATSVLALIGLEDIMSEYFSDSRIAFYVILNVWIADQFHSYCCHTPITKKYWLRFFYLYHTGFYVYYHIYSRRNAFMALFVSCILTMHMMLYFFHHFELPFVLNTFQIRMTMANRPQPAQNTRQNSNEADEPGSSQLESDSNIVLESNETEQVEERSSVETEFQQVELHISDLDDEMEEILADDDLIL